MPPASPLFNSSPWWYVAIALALVPCAGCGGAKTTTSPETGAKATPEKAAPEKATPEEEVKADIDALIANLEAEDYETFSKNFATDAFVKQFAGGKRKPEKIVASKKDAESIVKMLRKIRDVTPELNGEKTRASFRFIDSPTNDAGKTDELAAKRSVTLKGYGPDLNTVLDKAIAALEAEKFDEFIDHLFPETELKYLQDPAERARLRKLLNTPPMKKQSALVGSMLYDLRQLKTMTPKLEDSGNTAVYVYPLDADAVPNAQPKIVKLQKVKGSWRFFDNADVRRNIAKVRGLQPKAHTTTLTFEKSDGRWRFATLKK